MQGTEKRIKQLERTLMELGTEVFKNKNEILHLKSYHENFIKIVDGLKKIMDEKGLITIEDFEGAVELGEAIASTSMTNTPYDPSLDQEIERLKKASH